jgi:hypothetical protein
MEVAMKKYFFILFVLFIGCKENPVAPVQEPDYKEYVAIVTQSGAGDPKVKVLSNTLDGDISWSRISYGHYLIDSPGLFRVGKTVAFLTDGVGINSKYGLSIDSYFPNQITLYTWVSGVLTDSQLYNTSLTIRVYK